MKPKAVPLALAGVTLAASGLVLASQVPAFADCGSLCHGSWTWSEFTALTHQDDQPFIQNQLCNCDGRRITSDSEFVSGRKTIEYNNAAYSAGHVYISYVQNSNGVWHATRKEWGTNTGWNAWPLPCGSGCP